MDLTPYGKHDQLESFVMRDMLLHLFVERVGSNVVQAVGDGYSPIRLVWADWSIDALVATAKTKLFTFAKPIRQRIAGFYCTRPGRDTPIYVEDFVDDDAPYEIGRPGEGVKVTVKFRM